MTPSVCLINPSAWPLTSRYKQHPTLTMRNTDLTTETLLSVTVIQSRVDVRFKHGRRCCEIASPKPSPASSLLKYGPYGVKKLFLDLGFH